MRRTVGYIFVSLILVSLLGCKKEDPNPELLDPIYKDLSAREADSKKGYEDELVNRKNLELAVEKAEPNTPELRNARRDLEKSQEKVVSLEQMNRYYRIRAQRRLLVDRISYKEAFDKGEKWPDPHEYSDYQLNLRLRESPLNWGTRVPKLQDRLVSAHSKPAKAKGGGEKSEE